MWLNIPIFNVVYILRYLFLLKRLLISADDTCPAYSYCEHAFKLSLFCCQWTHGSSMRSVNSTYGIHYLYILSVIKVKDYKMRQFCSWPGYEFQVTLYIYRYLSIWQLLETISSQHNIDPKFTAAQTCLVVTCLQIPG